MVRVDTRGEALPLWWKHCLHLSLILAATPTFVWSPRVSGVTVSTGRCTLPVVSQPITKLLAEHRSRSLCLNTLCPQGHSSARPSSWLVAKLALLSEPGLSASTPGLPGACRPPQTPGPHAGLQLRPRSLKPREEAFLINCPREYLSHVTL